jgi:multimeric flavodoxin WrbA
MALDPTAPVSVLGISSSPRKNSNSELLLKQVLAGAEQAGARVEWTALREVTLRPCQACRSCEKTGECVQRDDFEGLRNLIIAADRVAVATPVYWMTVSAQLKLLMDRCQSLWARKYRLKRPLPSPANPPRIGVAIAVGGSKVGEMFTGIRLTMRYFFDVLSVARVHELYFHPYDRAGSIREHPTALQDAFKLGQVIGSRSPGAE